MEFCKFNSFIAKIRQIKKINVFNKLYRNNKTL